MSTRKGGTTTTDLPPTMPGVPLENAASIWLKAASSCFTALKKTTSMYFLGPWHRMPMSSMYRYNCSSGQFACHASMVACNDILKKHGPKTDPAVIVEKGTRMSLEEKHPSTQIRRASKK